MWYVIITVIVLTIIRFWNRIRVQARERHKALLKCKELQKKIEQGSAEERGCAEATTNFSQRELLITKHSFFPAELGTEEGEHLLAQKAFEAYQKYIHHWKQEQGEFLITTSGSGTEETLLEFKRRWIFNGRLYTGGNPERDHRYN